MLQVQDEDFPALTRVTTWRQGTTTTTGAEKIGGEGEVIEGYPLNVGNNGPYVVRGPGGPRAYGQPYGQPQAYVQPYAQPYVQPYGQQFLPIGQDYEIIEPGYGYRQAVPEPGYGYATTPEPYMVYPPIGSVRMHQGPFMISGAGMGAYANAGAIMGKGAEMGAEMGAGAGEKGPPMTEQQAQHVQWTQKPSQIKHKRKKQGTGRPCGYFALIVAFLILVGVVAIVVFFLYKTWKGQL